MAILSKLTSHPLWKMSFSFFRPIPRMLSTLHERVSNRFSLLLHSRFQIQGFPKEPAPKIEGSFHHRTLEIVRSAFPSHTIESLEIERLGCAMTNEVYVCSLPSSEKLLLRFYGQNTEVFFERHRELATFRKLSEKGYGPKLIASFETGRLEEYIDSTTLNKELIRDPETSKEIAHEVLKLHTLFPEGQQEDSELWLGLKKWYEKAVDAAALLKAKGREKELFGLSLHDLRREMKELKAFLTQHAYSPVVFCHNDAQYGNILRKKSNGNLVLIDYEYAGYNYRGFDIGNHFCEWAADYDSPEPHRLDFSQYPTKEQQFIFFKAYLTRQYKQENIVKGEYELWQEMEQMYLECNQFGLASHLKWCLWGIIQAAHSQIEFDYLDYARQRFEEYLSKKPIYLVMAS